MKRCEKVLSSLVFVGLCISGTTTTLFAQEANPTSQNSSTQNPEITKQDNGIYLYRVKVVQRDLDAVNYLHRSGSTKIGFRDRKSVV